MIKTVLIIFSITTLFFPVNGFLFSQEKLDVVGKEAERTRFPKYVGFGLSSYSGYGFVFQHHIFDSKQRLRYSGFVLYRKSDMDNEFSPNIGVLYRYDLSELLNLFKFYTGAGVEYYYSKYSYRVEDINSVTGTPLNTLTTYKEETHMVSLGGVLGFDFILWNRIVLNFDFGMSYAASKNTITNSISHSVGPAGAIGLCIKFGDK